MSALMLGPNPRPVKAAVVLALDLAGLVERADLIVIATALEQRSRWDGEGRIVTDVTLRVDENLKGSGEPDPELVVTQLGGEIDGIGMRVAGSPRFQQGRSAIVFLREVPEYGELQVVGMSQGLLHIAETDHGSVVIPNHEGLALFERAENGELVRVRNPLPVPVPVREVVSEIRRLIARSHDR